MTEQGNEGLHWPPGPPTPKAPFLPALGHAGYFGRSFHGYHSGHGACNVIGASQTAALKRSVLGWWCVPACMCVMGEVVAIDASPLT